MRWTSQSLPLSGMRQLPGKARPRRCWWSCETGPPAICRSCRQQRKARPGVDGGRPGRGRRHINGGAHSKTIQELLVTGFWAQLCHQTALGPSLISGTGCVTLEDDLMPAISSPSFQKWTIISTEAYLMGRVNEKAIHNTSYIWCPQHGPVLKIILLGWRWSKPEDPENYQLMHSPGPGWLAFSKGLCLHFLVLSLRNVNLLQAKKT